MYRITLQSSTAFFKNDMTITSVQQTYGCPPLSTIYGLLSAATGDKIEPMKVGYIFDYQYKVDDFELITRSMDSEYKNAYYELIESGKAIDRHDILQGFYGAVPVHREILFKCTLHLYLEDEAVAACFSHPYYTLLMGRSEDLACVKRIDRVDLKHGQRDIVIGKTIIPFNPSESEIFGRICSMPVYISDDIPRKVIRAGIFMIVDRDKYRISNASDRFLYDEDLDRGVFIHTPV